MSYASTNIIIYGIELTIESDVQKLLDYFESKLEDSKYDYIGCIIEEIIPEEDLSIVKCLENNPSHINGIETPRFHTDIPRYNRDRTYHNMEVWSEGTDSRIHSNDFDLDETDHHFFGIYCGSNGYAYSDKIMDIIKNIPQKAIDNFENYCQPILDEIGIDIKPSEYLCNQMW